MICFPNCKINIGLYVTRRRGDGYHDLETIFYPLPLTDALEVAPARSGTPQLHLSGLGIAGSAQDNLVWKAWELMQERYPGLAPLDLFLHKALPMGAGLGGGSADGAFMLRLLNDYYQLGLDNGELAQMALKLGSDCPFFIYNRPKYAAGRGELMEDIEISLQQYSIQLICPNVHVSTAEAFRMLSPASAPFDLRRLPEHDVRDWSNIIRNDFEAPVFKKHPVLAAIKKELVAQGALFASLTGSGSAVYGLFPKRQKPSLQHIPNAVTLYVE